MSVDIQLRLEEPADYHLVENIAREAFWGQGHPGCDEHYLVHKLRSSDDFVPELDFVATLGKDIIGHILYTRAKIVDDNSNAQEVLTFGPLSVLPKYQGKGVGGKLLAHTINIARDLGYRAIVLFGWPDYYPRYGFKRGADFGIQTPGGQFFASLMAMPLYESALNGVTGRFIASPDFSAEGADVDAFDMQFPKKEKVFVPTADILYESLPKPAGEAMRERNITMLWSFRIYGEEEVLRWPGMDEDTVGKLKSILHTHGFRWGK